MLISEDGCPPRGGRERTLYGLRGTTHTLFPHTLRKLHEPASWSPWCIVGVRHASCFASLLGYLRDCCVSLFLLPLLPVRSVSFPPFSAFFAHVGLHGRGCGGFACADLWASRSGWEAVQVCRWVEWNPTSDRACHPEAVRRLRQCHDSSRHIWMACAR